MGESVAVAINSGSRRRRHREKENLSLSWLAVVTVVLIRGGSGFPETSGRGSSVVLGQRRYDRDHLLSIVGLAVARFTTRLGLVPPPRLGRGAR